MVQSGGEVTMLGQWRIVLRQAEEAARAGRYDEALALASRPDVADHHHAVQLRGRLAHRPDRRAGRRGEADDLAGAIDDLEPGRTLGAAPTPWPPPGCRLADRVAGEVRDDLDAGEPGRVVERVDGARPAQDRRARRCGGPARPPRPGRRPSTRAAAASSAGPRPTRPRRAARRRARRADALAAARRDVEARQKAAAPQGRGASTRRSKRASGPRSLPPPRPCWKRSPSTRPPARPGPAPGSRSPRSARPPPPSPAAASGSRSRPRPPRRRRRTATPPATALPTEAAPIVWLPDRARGPHAAARGPWPGPAKPGRRGGSCSGSTPSAAISSASTIRSSSAAPATTARRTSRSWATSRGNHATLVRDGDGYVLRAHQPTFVNGRPVETTTLRDGDVIRLGATVELEFHQPSPVSSTAAALGRQPAPAPARGRRRAADGRDVHRR